MKFTEGYWLRSERANALYATQAFQVEALEDRLRVVSPVRPIGNREDTLNNGTITTEFASVNENTIGVRSWHFEGYESREPAFEKHTTPCPVEITITEEEAVMRAGKVTVRVDRRTFQYAFEADGKTLTTCGFRNLGNIRWNRQPSTMLPQENYLGDAYQPYMVAELSLDVGECVYGLGERFTAFVKNGQTVEIWNEDGGTSSQISYKNVPFYITNRHYGVFVDHTTPVSFEVASEKVGCVGFSVPGEELRFQMIYGETMGDILSSYTAVTGRPALPPAWSFGLWLSTSFTTNYDEGTVASFIDGMQRRDIPFSVFHFDCFWMKELRWCDFEWDEHTFPDVSGMLRRYKEKGLKICVWINPYIAQGTRTFQEAAEGGFLLRRKDGKGIKQMDHWQPGMGVVDFTNPGASEWYAEKLRGLLRAGVDCFKTDFGERIPVDVLYHNGADPKGMHNLYTHLYNRRVYDLLRQERGEKEAVVFARSATAGGQQFPVHWGGDNAASYPSMAESLRGGLSFMLSGFSFWSHDIGGFEMTATPDLYKRWVQFGLLSTHSRLHGSQSYRVPWSFDEEACDILRRFVQLKCQLMPYLYGAAVYAHQTGIPVMRPMPLAFGGDPAVDYLDRQYMLGDSLLVAPIFNAEGKGEYYLPEAAGPWTHLLTDEIRQCGWHREHYGYDSLPLFVKPNTLLPLGSGKERPDYDYVQGLELHLYALKDETHCQVPDVEGNVVLEASAVRRAEGVTLSLSRQAEALSFVLHGVLLTEEAVRGGDVRVEGRNTRITPDAGVREIEITDGLEA